MVPGRVVFPEIVSQLRRTVVRCHPKIIVAVGRYAIKWCLKRGFDLATEHGRKFEIQIGDHKTFCVPIYHPSTWGRVERELREKADVLAVARFLQETGLPSIRPASS